MGSLCHVSTVHHSILIVMCALQRGLCANWKKIYCCAIGMYHNISDVIRWNSFFSWAIHLAMSSYINVGSIHHPSQNCHWWLCIWFCFLWWINNNKFMETVNDGTDVQITVLFYFSFDRDDLIILTWNDIVLIEAHCIGLTSLSFHKIQVLLFRLEFRFELVTQTVNFL